MTIKLLLFIVQLKCIIYENILTHRICECMSQGLDRGRLLTSRIGKIIFERGKLESFVGIFTNSELTVSTMYSALNTLTIQILMCLIHIFVSI